MNIQQSGLSVPAETGIEVDNQAGIERPSSFPPFTESLRYASARFLKQRGNTFDSIASYEYSLR